MGWPGCPGLRGLWACPAEGLVPSPALELQTWTCLLVATALLPPPSARDAAVVTRLVGPELRPDGQCSRDP